MISNWIRMGREDAWKTLDRLGDKRDAVVFSKETTEVSWRSLPFYSQYRLFRLVNYATLPVFTQYYLSTGVEFVALDGTAEPIYSVNTRDPIKLTETTVIPYLDFFFANVIGSEGEVFLIKDPRNAPFFSALSPEQMQSVLSSFKPLHVTREADGADKLHVTGTIFYGGGLLSASISVREDGQITFGEQNMLLTGVHFPHQIYGNMWLEG